MYTKLTKIFTYEINPLYGIQSLIIPPFSINKIQYLRSLIIALTFKIPNFIPVPKWQNGK